MFHLIWYILIGLIAGIISKSVMHVHLTLFWTIALGSGYRSVIEQLDKVSRDRVKNATLDYICKRNVRSVETNAIYSIARKP